MKTNEFAAAFKDLMDNYNKYRANWVSFYGNEKGFDEWFTKQTIK